MKCSVCGDESTNGVRFCRKCGSRFEVEESGITSAVTRPIVKDVVFPQSGTAVVPMENAIEPPITEAYKPPVWPDNFVPPTDILPEESLAFVMEPTLFHQLFVDAFEPRGLFQLKSSYVEKGTGVVLWSKRKYVPDETIKCKHIELLFAKNKAFTGDWRIQEEPKALIRFTELESVKVKRGMLKAKVIIKMKPEKSIRLLAVDPIVREAVLTICWKDVAIAKKLASAIMYEISANKLQGFLRG